MAKAEPCIVCRDEAPRQDKTELQFPMAKLGIYGGLTVAFCCALIISNVLATKTLDLGMFVLSASILTFPIVYIINDVLSDVYGFHTPEVILVMLGSQILLKRCMKLSCIQLRVKFFLLSVSTLSWSGSRSRIHRFSSYSLEVKWGSEGNRNPICFSRSYV